VSQRLVGTYSWSVPGSTWTLILRSSGAYDLAMRGTLDKNPRPIESGNWAFKGFTLVLESKQPPVSGPDYRRLYVVSKKSGRLMLVSALRVESYVGEPFGQDILFDYVFVPANDMNEVQEKSSTSRQSPTR
jgi:hypothetical protein